MAVLVVALRTFEITGVTMGYTRWAHLVGGVLLVVIGAFLMFKPQWLSFA